MKRTIYDIARKAGVSITTVSRVINQNYPVSEATRRKVLQVIEEFGFSPNHVARSLATNKTATLGVVGSDLTNPYFGEVIDGIQTAAFRHSLQVMLQNSRDAQEEVDAVKLLLDRQVDGIIFIARHEHTPNQDHIAQAAQRMPVVSLGHPLEHDNAYSICGDMERGMHILVRRLVELGHRNFLFLGGREGSYPTVCKLKALREVLDETAGSRLEVALTGYTYSSGERVKEWLDSGLLAWCTAIVCVSDFVALGALNVLQRSGVDVPGTLSITGFDNIAWTARIRPNLTTVDPDKEKLAAGAVDLVVKALAGEWIPQKHSRLPVRVVWRESHGPARTSTPA